MDSQYFAQNMLSTNFTAEYEAFIGSYLLYLSDALQQHCQSAAGHPSRVRAASGALDKNACWMCGEVVAAMRDEMVPYDDRFLEDFLYLIIGLKKDKMIILKKVSVFVG